MTYIIYRTELKYDQNALRTYTKRENPSQFDFEVAKHACVERAPSATRANIRDLVKDPQFGMKFVEGLAAKSSCDSRTYINYATLVLSDMLELTVMDRVCQTIANATEQSRNETEAIAGK